MQIETFGDHKLILGDGYEIAQRYAQCAIVTDPPYEIIGKGGGIGAKREYLKDITQAELETGFNLSVLDVFDEIIVFCSKKQIRSLIEYAEQRKLTWHLLTWNKTNPTPLVNGNYLPDTEYWFHIHAQGKLVGGYHDKARFLVHKAEKNNFDHPTVKPLTVMKKALRTVKNQDIIDPFMGTATTGLACLELGKTFVGVEKNQKYFDIARRRFEEAFLNNMITEVLNEQTT